MSGAHPPWLRRALPTLAVIAALQAIAVLVYVQVERSRGGAREEDSFRYERVGGSPRLPAVELERADGTLLRTDDLRDRRVLLHFWASWCPPCREELPGLLQLGRAEPGLQVVALSLDDDWATVRQFFGGAVPQEVLRDPSGTLVKTYEVGSLPDTYLIDRDGAAALRFGGARDWRSRAARELLARELEAGR